MWLTLNRPDGRRVMIASEEIAQINELSKDAEILLNNGKFTRVTETFGEIKTLLEEETE